MKVAPIWTGSDFWDLLRETDPNDDAALEVLAVHFGRCLGATTAGDFGEPPPRWRHRPDPVWFRDELLQALWKHCFLREELGTMTRKRFLCMERWFRYGWEAGLNGEEAAKPFYESANGERAQA